MDGAAATLVRRLQTDFATPLLPAPNSRPVAAASPSRYTNLKNHPKRSDKHFERPHGTCSLLVPHYSVRAPFRAARRSRDPPVRFRLPMRRVHCHALQELRHPPFSRRPAQISPNSTTKIAPHSIFCSRNSARSPVCPRTARYPSRAPPLTPGRTALHPFRIAGSAPPDRVPSLWTWTFSRRPTCALASADTRRGRELFLYRKGPA